MSTAWKTIKNVQKAVSKKKPTKKKAENKVKEEAPKLSAKEAFRGFVYDTLKNVFSLTEKDGDVNVNIDNVFPLMKALELDTKDETILDMIHEACIENFGNIEIGEFDDTIMGQRRRVTGEEFEDDIRSAFRLIDIDADGFITIQDLYQLMMGIGEMLTDDELSKLLKAADNDGDGMINYKDFKFFLTGELTEDAPEDPEVEQDAEAEPQDGDENEAEGENENADKTEGEDAKEVVEEVEEEVKPKTQEEIEAEERRERMKKKSILWAFASQPLPEKKEEPIAPVETPQPSDEAVDDKSAENEKKNDNENQSETSDLKPVTSVTVNYLDSIKEEGDTTDAVTSEQNDNDGSKSELPNASTRRQSFSAMTSVDSGIDGTDAEEIQKHSVEQSESITDDGFISRTHSAKSRLTYDRSRASSARSNFTSRPSTAGSRYDDDIEESVQDEEESQAFSGRSERRSSKSTAGDIEKDEDSEESVIIEDDEFKSPLSSRQIEFLENSKEQQIYCEAGVVRDPDNDISDDDTLDLESIIQYDPYTISPRVNLTRLKKEKTKSVPVLERSRSATRLRTFKKIENAILIRQNTDPRLNIAHIKAANERTMRERNQKCVQRKLNSNGLCCTHINIDLNVEDEAKPKVSAQQTSLKMLLKRPQTAMTFREAEKLNIVYGKNYETISNKYSSSRDIKIVDLSNMVSMDTDRYETPGLVNHHHGYKSVLPLGRVLSGHKSKINNGNGIVLNSMSRKLERIANLTQIANDKQTRSQHNLTHHHHHKISNLSNRQSIINLEMPDLISKQKQTCRTYSPRYFSRSLIRT